MKNRYKQRSNRRIVNELLGLKDICGTKDPTPYEAVKEIVQTSKKQPNKKAAKPPNKQENELTPNLQKPLKPSKAKPDL